MSDSNNKKKKTGILAAIWESMTKTGGCCGSGESCGCSKSGNVKSKDGKMIQAPRKIKKHKR